MEKNEIDELKRLREENALLRRLLSEAEADSYAISERSDLSRNTENDSLEASRDSPSSAAGSHPTPREKIALFRRLFRGREDLYPLRWESSSGKSGYSPACGNEWKPGVCRKPQVKCGVCAHSAFLPVTDEMMYEHLAGHKTMGVYPLEKDDTCSFLAVDFDDEGWKDDALAFLHSCKELGVPASLEISRSGNGAHVWVFFSESIPARKARRMGTAIISHTCRRTRQLSLTSYDRLFPNQDALPKGGFGNLIALPLQRTLRKKGRSVFVDEHFVPYPDQWAYLLSIERMSGEDVGTAVLLASEGSHPLDLSYPEVENADEPWAVKTPPTYVVPGLLPASLTLVLAERIYIAKSELSTALTNRLVRLAAFPNPEFYRAQAMRLSVWNKARVVGCAENFPKHIALPRGCLEDVIGLLEMNDVRPILQDERAPGTELNARFLGTLRSDQKTAVEAILNHDTGVLSAPTGSGKTVVAAAVITRRQTNTLVLVHRTDLMRQWQEQLGTFLRVAGKESGTSNGDPGIAGGDASCPGVIGGSKNRPTGLIDIAVLQTLTRRDDAADFISSYGQIIVDECHHISAFSFESMLKQARARYVLGLTATPYRRDGHHPIIFMQCGPVRHTAVRPASAPSVLEVLPRFLSAPTVPPDATIQDVFRILVRDAARNRRIAADIHDAVREGRKVLVLSSRTEHLDLLRDAMNTTDAPCFVLHGRMSRKRRAAVLEELRGLDGSAPHVILATGRLVGEGFDHPPLDTLMLAMPISWKGSLQQYAGRLHRDHVDKGDVRIYDYVEQDLPQLSRMWNKRLKGYRAMGYRVRSEATLFG